jgi:hypothetical protein
VPISIGPVELSTDGYNRVLKHGFSIITANRLVLHLAFETQEKAESARYAVQRGKRAIEAFLSASAITANGRQWPKDNP